MDPGVIVKRKEKNKRMRQSIKFENRIYRFIDYKITIVAVQCPKLLSEMWFISKINQE